MPRARNTASASAQPTRRSTRGVKRPDYAALNNPKKSRCSPKGKSPEAVVQDPDYDSDATIIAEVTESEPLEPTPEWELYEIAFRLMCIYQSFIPDHSTTLNPMSFADEECVGEGCEECARRDRTEMECTICNGTEPGCTDRCIENGAVYKDYMVEGECLEESTRPDANNMDP
ncbi:hypothetical protein BDD12DRAFT_802623 [Trichophaea hybrida]|nr:hypothetical protein BDD12DRAFT_802623 [Trichophaea hybrida]